MRRGHLLQHVRPVANQSCASFRTLPFYQATRLFATGGFKYRSDDELSWPARIAFGALAVAVTGAVGYQMTRYQQRSSTQILEPTSFRPFVLTSKEPVSTTCSIFHLTPKGKPISTEDPYLPCWNRPVWSVQSKQPQLQIARSYTPLPPAHSAQSRLLNEQAGLCTLRFLIREEENGEVSSYLHRLPVGAGVDLRGPQVEFELPLNTEEVMFLAGGTGIAPALQIAHALRPGARGMTRLPRMRIIWANRKREECEGGFDDQPKPSKAGWTSWFGGGTSAEPTGLKPKSPIVQELEGLKSLYHGRLTVYYYVDEENTFVDRKVLQQSLPGSADKASLPGKKVVIVSGPEGFVKYLAGPKEWKNGKESQGPLGGVLKDILPSDWTAIKL